MIICPVEDWDTAPVVFRSSTEYDIVGWVLAEPLNFDDLQTFTSIWEAEVENSQFWVPNVMVDVVWTFGLMGVALENARRIRREKIQST